MLQFFMNLKLKYKLFFSYLLVCLVLSGCFLTFFESSITDLTTKNLLSSSEKLLQLTGKEVSACFQTVETLQNSFIVNSQLQKTLSKDASIPLNEQLNDYVFLENTVFSYQDYQNISLVRLMVNPDFIYAKNSINFFPLPKTADTLSPFEQKVFAADGKIVWSNAVSQTSSDAQTQNVICSGRLVRSYNDFTKIVGAVFIEISMNAMVQILSSASFFDNSIFLLTEDGEVICTYTPDSFFLEEPAQTFASGQDLSSLNANHLVTSASVGTTGWTLVSAIPSRVLTQQMAAFRGKVVLMIFLVCFAALLLSYWVSYLYTKRIERLITRLEEAPLQKFPLTNVVYRDEISQLERHFNALFGQIDTLLQQQFALGQQVEKSKYELLRAQINPHFLYNTLDFINLMSIKKDVPEISEVIYSLARFYKLSLNHGESTISVAGELQQIQAYLDIQNHRFQIPIHLSVNVDAALLSVAMPNLILQPLVENAVLHGIQKGSAGTGVIRISAQQTATQMILSIEDNGIGCDTNILNNLLAPCSFSTSKHYGIRNVHRRLQLSCGDCFGLRFEPSPLGGVKADIILPALDAND